MFFYPDHGLHVFMILFYFLWK